MLRSHFAAPMNPLPGYAYMSATDNQRTTENLSVSALWLLAYAP